VEELLGASVLGKRATTEREKRKERKRESAAFEVLKGDKLMLTRPLLFRLKNGSFAKGDLLPATVKGHGGGVQIRRTEIIGVPD